MNFNIIYTHGVARIEPDDASSFDQVLIDKSAEHNLTSVKESLCFSAYSLIVEYFWISSVGIFSANLPGREEWVPVDVVEHLIKVKVFKYSCAQESWSCDVNELPVSFKSLRAGSGK